MFNCSASPKQNRRLFCLHISCQEFIRFVSLRSPFPSSSAKPITAMFLTIYRNHRMPRSCYTVHHHHYHRHRRISLHSSCMMSCGHTHTHAYKAHITATIIVAIAALSIFYGAISHCDLGCLELCFFPISFQLNYLFLRSLDCSLELTLSSSLSFPTTIHCILVQHSSGHCVEYWPSLTLYFCVPLIFILFTRFSISNVFSGQLSQIVFVCWCLTCCWMLTPLDSIPAYHARP